MLTDNDYLMQMRAAAQAVGKNTPGRVNLSGLGLPFANIAGPKTSTEKAAIRKYVEDQMMNNARNTSVYNPNIGKNVRFNRTGIEKAIGTTNDEGKLRQLASIKEIVENGTPYSSPKVDEYGNKYTYLFTPTSNDGVYGGAATTLKRGNFYNVNSIEEALRRKKALTSDSRHHREDVRANNSIAEYLKNVKALRNTGQRSVKDVLINTARPAYVGQTAEILRRNKRKEK